MIDKQIIDEMIEKIGFDVQQCGYLKIIKDALNYPEIGGTYTAFECNLYSRDCDFIERCRYKQLLRKEQECEELQETANAYNYLVKLANYRLDKIEDLQQQLEQLKQTLAEIKEIAEIEIECKTYEIENDCFNETRCKALNEHIDFIKQILQKISDFEVKNE